MPYTRYGCAHEAELWQEFQHGLNKTETTGWLYDGQSATRVADLGYFIGYRISQAYYEQAKDKKQAIATILNVSNFDDFLRASGYGDRWIAEHAAASRCRSRNGPPAQITTVSLYSPNTRRMASEISPTVQ